MTRPAYTLGGFSLVRVFVGKRKPYHGFDATRGHIVREFFCGLTRDSASNVERRTMKDTYEVLCAGRARYDGRYTVNTVDPDFDLQSSVEFADFMKNEDPLFGLTVVEFGEDEQDAASAWLRGRGIL
jgi:hypothetical protein